MFQLERWRKIRGHQKGGQFKLDASKMKFHFSNKQQGGKVIEGNELRDELKGKPVYNVNLLDYLLKNPHLVPKKLKGEHIFFWGTVYSRTDGSLCARYLYGNGYGWS